MGKRRRSTTCRTRTRRPRFERLIGEEERLDAQNIELGPTRRMIVHAFSSLSELIHYSRELPQLCAVITSMAEQSQAIFDSFQTKVADRAKGSGYLTDWTRTQILKQVDLIDKLEHVIQRVAELYCKMHQGHIQEGLELLTTMPAITGHEVGRAALNGWSEVLRVWYNEAQVKTMELLQQEQAEFSAEINARMKAVISKGIPAARPGHLQEAEVEAKVEARVEVEVEVEA